ncbi:MAG: N-6 DNA methylase [Candidatus Heimdallarchaeota archaeon]|nr:MAG: N-6 DNA methylase [Candidatus Heimdallarchaeota archaeon]
MTAPIKNPTFTTQNECITEINEWMGKCKSIFNFNDPPVLIHNQNEFLLSVLAGLWLLQFFNQNRAIKSTTKVFKKLEDLKHKYPNSNSLWGFLNGLFTDLSEKTILDSLLLIERPNLREAFINDVLGSMLQHSLPLDERKRLAANYTTIRSARILVNLIELNAPSSIIDPFCGSGRLITTYLRSLKQKSQFPRIRIHDLMASAVLIAYCQLILILSERNQDYSIIQASIGDAFAFFASDVDKRPKEHETYDLILMNPPFTRTHRINSDQRRSLLKLEHKYKKYLSGQIGLHIYGILLADILIKENGVIGTVLPAATILSQYSSGIHELLLNNYQLQIIAASEDVKSCSEDSNLREIFLVAKRKKTRKEGEVKFIRISEPFNVSKWNTSPALMIPKETLIKEWNWTIFLKDPEFLRIRDIFLQSGFLKNGTDLNLDIVRGVEMYGPNFFFIPNRKWKIISEGKKEIILRSKEKTIAIPKEFLVRSLRKPGKYTQLISPSVSDFVLSISDSNKELPKWLEDYLIASKQFASPAKRRFGSEWISHIHTQIKTKKPWGNLFFIDKFGISTTSVMGHFFDSKLICSKNFYVLRNCSSNQAKLLCAWLNSTIFIVLFLLSRREIGGSYGRLQIVDYMKEPLFLDVSKLSTSQKNLIIKEFDTMRKLKLPPIPDQLQLPQRIALDQAIIQGIHLLNKGEKKLLTEVYALLERTFKALKRRDKA